MLLFALTQREQQFQGQQFHSSMKQKRTLGGHLSLASTSLE